MGVLSCLWEWSVVLFKWSVVCGCVHFVLGVVIWLWVWSAVAFHV